MLGTAIPSTLLESPSWDPAFYFIYPVVVPVFGLGILFNAVVMFTMLSDRPNLIAHRIDRIIFLLLATLCVYSMFACVCQFLIRLFHASAAYSSFLGWTGSILVLLLFIVNLALAMERRSTIMFPNDDAAPQTIQKQYIILGMLLLVFSSILTWIYVTSPSRNGLSPYLRHQKLVWVVIMASAMIPIIGLTCWLYFTTYMHVYALLSKTGLSKVQALQKQALMSCIIMSSTLVVLYTPEIVFQTLNLAVTFSDNTFHVWSRIVFFIASLDVLICPGLVLYFRRDIRRRIYSLTSLWTRMLYGGKDRSQEAVEQMIEIQEPESKQTTFFVIAIRSN
ncbi:hypothetical protein BDR26DRAFT_871801 [Obelidium mucronatum]|nr:hypothetical protein BDR26DRAFT_871801 [Obelidium mucronatum]